MNLLFSIGLGLDIAGGAMIAVGLLGSPATFAQRATTFFGGSPHLASAQIESRADAELGIPVLLSGFTAQLVSQSVTCSVSDGCGYLIAATCALIPLSIWHWLWRPYRQKKLAIQVAHYEVPNNRSQPERMALPSLSVLASIGVGLGEPVGDGESDEQYVARVFGVTDTSE